jgi:cytochrome c-type biogenesis protein CcmE
LREHAVDQVADIAAPVREAGRAGQVRVVVAGLIVLAALAYLVWASFPQGTVYYQTVEELSRKPSDPQPVRVAGLVAQGSIERSTGTPRLQFEIVDGTGGTASTGGTGDAGSGSMKVQYDGVVPDIFGPDIEVVVEGRRDAAGVFQADTLLAKCPSRFESAVPTPGSGGEPRS